MPILSEEDLERFRTKVCTLASSMRCDFGVERCNYSHNLYWARRCPFYLRDSSILRYIPTCCPDVELGPGSAILKNTCPRGNNCSFAHSLEEMHYHPLVYKTELCKDYRLGRCKTYYCHMVHGLAEFRVPRDFVLPRKRGLNIPTYAHVTMVDNMRTIQGGSSSCGHIKDKSRVRSERDSPKASPLALQPAPRPELTKGRLERIGSDSVSNGELFLKMKPDVIEHRHGNLRWIQEDSSSLKQKSNSSVFDGFRLEDAGNSESLKPLNEPLKKSATYGSNIKLMANIDEYPVSDAESTTPWYGKGVDIPDMPAYNFSSFDTIFQESLKSMARQVSETATGETVSKNNSLAITDAMLGRSVKVVRNVGGWESAAPVQVEHSMQQSVERSIDVVPGKDNNSGLMEYIYHTIAQHSAAISDKCVTSSDNRANLEEICKEAHSLWQLIVSIQSLLYESSTGCNVEEATSTEANGFEGQWANIEIGKSPASVTRSNLGEQQSSKDSNDD